jgi:hypothetical protein
LAKSYEFELNELKKQKLDFAKERIMLNLKQEELTNLSKVVEIG